MSKAIISAHNLTIGYSKTTVSQRTELYNNLSFNLRQGTLTCLLGVNGAGKSTLIRTICGMQPPLAGKVMLEDKSIDEYKETDLSEKLGLVLTDKTSVGGLTVYQLVALGRYPYTGFFGRLTKKDKAIIQHSIDSVCMAHKLNSYMAELSDGERQKVMIAKALAQECPIIVLDEPTAFLDAVSRIEIMNLLHSLAYTQQKTILMSTHDIELALMQADELWLLSKENGLKCGNTEDLILNDAFDHFFARSGIVFDKKSGSFQTAKKFDRKVFLLTEGDELHHWTKNFLFRNYWGITIDEKEALFTLTIKSPNNIDITNLTDKLNFDSFENLLNWMNLKYPFNKD